MILTIFTPTYNRAHTLPRLFESLCRQSCKDFEWILIDDWSSDGTPALAEAFEQCDRGFEMTHLRVANGGKHRAINRAVQLAQGEFFFIVDSDDYLTDDAAALVHEWLGGIDDSFAGVSGLRGYDENTATVDRTPFGDVLYLDLCSHERPTHGLDGDMSEVYRTALLRRYPFPEFEGENFVTEAVVWDAISYAGHPMRWYNRVIYICEYLEDGLSRNAHEVNISNPRGYCHALNLRLTRSRAIFQQRQHDRWRYFDVLRYRYSFGEICSFLQISRLTLFCARVLHFIGK